MERSTRVALGGLCAAIGLFSGQPKGSFSFPARPHANHRPYCLDGPVLPLVQALFPWPRRRAALMGRHRRLKEIEVYGSVDPPGGLLRSAVFWAKTSGAYRCGTNTRHAFYLPTDDDGDGRLDHVTLYGTGAFPRDEVRAIENSPGPLR